MTPDQKQRVNAIRRKHINCFTLTSSQVTDLLSIIDEQEKALTAYKQALDVAKSRLFVDGPCTCMDCARNRDALADIAAFEPKDRP